MAELFRKVLSQTDIDHRLAFPTALLREFPFPVGAHATTFHATDATYDEWSFKLSVRRNDPNPKPVLSGEWLRFVQSKGLKVGDRVILYRDGAQYNIRAERKIFGVWANVM